MSIHACETLQEKIREIDYESTVSYIIRGGMKGNPKIMYKAQCISGPKTINLKLRHIFLEKLKQSRSTSTIRHEFSK
jgi:hypothetical protein